MMVWPFGAPRPPQNAPKTHPRRNLDFQWIWDRFREPVWSAAPHRGSERVKLVKTPVQSGIIPVPPLPGCPKTTIQNEGSRSSFSTSIFGCRFFRPFWPFGRPFAPPLALFGHFGRISASILARFWLRLGPRGPSFTSLFSI